VREALRPGEGGDLAAAANARFDVQLRHWHEHGFGLWAAGERGSAEIAGWIGAWHPDFIPELTAEIELGWTLRPPFWGRGLATEGALAALEAVSIHLRPPRVISIIDPGNARSIAVARRLGMRASRGVVHPELGLETRVYERLLPG
jgi:RimJ/RimL family protein N-acetyltransferase